MKYLLLSLLLLSHSIFSMDWLSRKPMQKPQAIDNHIFDAVKKGDDAWVHSLLQWGGVNPNTLFEVKETHQSESTGDSTTTIEYSTLLLEATRRNNLDLMREFIEYGARVNGGEFLVYPPLFKAIDNDSAQAIEILVKAGANPNALYFIPKRNKNKFNRLEDQGTPLQHALYTEKKEAAVVTLLTLGANPMHESNRPHTTSYYLDPRSIIEEMPLFLAVRKKCVFDTLALFLERGADPLYGGQLEDGGSYESPFHYASIFYKQAARLFLDRIPLENFYKQWAYYLKIKQNPGEFCDPLLLRRKGNLYTSCYNMRDLIIKKSLSEAKANGCTLCNEKILPEDEIAFSRCCLYTLHKTCVGKRADGFSCPACKTKSSEWGFTEYGPGYALSQDCMRYFKSLGSAFSQESLE